MDGIFTLPEAVRADFLRYLVQSLGCTYVCLWQQHDSNSSNRYLFFLDGFYDIVTNNQPSSSLGSVAESLFHQYQGLTFHINHDCVPGVAFRNHFPYIELQQSDLLRLASTKIQTQFFREARIEMAVFMGCKKGEIELGFSKISQTDIQAALKNLFPHYFYIHSQSTDQNQPSSSYSSSLSTGIPETLLPSQTSPHQQSIQEQALFSQVIPSYFPTPEGEHEAIIRALLRVISSPSSSTSTQQHQVPQQILPNYASVILHPEDTAFNRYKPDISTPQMGSNWSLAFFRNSMRMRERNIVQAARPLGTQQQYHMISERRRREKLNKSFQALRALLPPGSKKNKEWILTTAKETVRSLMDEIEKLNTRNEQLMTVLSGKEANSTTEENKGCSSNSNERLSVRVWHASESSSSEERMVDLQVTVRGESSQVHVLIRLLEFLKRVQNVNLISMGAAANNHVTGGTTINQLTFRLRITEGSEWDERGFQEAVRRAVAEVIQCQLDQ